MATECACAMALFPQQSESSAESHRHYGRTALTRLQLLPDADDRYHVVTARQRWTIKRSARDFQRLDTWLHTCVVARDVSGLAALSALPTSLVSASSLARFCTRLNRVLSDERVLQALKCLLLLNWFESDQNGLRLQDARANEINRRALGAAFLLREWTAPDGLALRQGQLVAVLERVRSQDQLFVKAKSGAHVTLLPSDCLQLIEGSDSVRQCLRRRRDDARRRLLPSSPSVARKTFFPLFSAKSPVKEAEERPKADRALRPPNVFGRDLSEQLFESACDVPPVVSACCEFIERFGLSDGVYRLSGVASNIARLKLCFESGARPDLAEEPHARADPHCVSSLLKLFFRALPNPLLTFESFDAFVHVIRDDQRRRQDDARRPETTLRALSNLCRRLPPPHYRTLRALCTHLKRVSLESARTGMTAKNLSIVWAPNLLRARDIESALNCFEIIGIQTLLTQFLIEFAHEIFEKHEKRAPDRRSKKLSQILVFEPIRDRIEKSKSFESFFQFQPQIGLNFAKTRTKCEIIPLAFNFDLRSDPPPLSVPFFSPCLPSSRAPLIHNTVTTRPSLVVRGVVSCVVDDAVVVRLNSRERIERIKEKRRQQLREQFGEEEPKPIPCPRRTAVRAVPTPTPRRSRPSPEIRILLTKKSKN